MALRSVMLLLLALLQSAAPQNCETRRFDRTLEEGATGRSVVEATVNKIKGSGIFGDDHGFLRRMAPFETEDGAVMTPGTGGIWSVSADALRTIHAFTIRGHEPLPELENQIEQLFCFKWSETIGNINDLDVPLYSALAVMLYLSTRGQSDIPEDLTAQAALWRDAFNPDGDIEAFKTHGNCNYCYTSNYCCSLFFSSPMSNQGS